MTQQLQSNNNAALIVFTRGYTAMRVKTRMEPALTSSQCSEVHRAFLLDIATMCSNLSCKGVDIIISIASTDDGATRRVFSQSAVRFVEQAPGSFADRMTNAFTNTFAMGYKRVAIIGSDSPELTADCIMDVFERLKTKDAVFGPSTDGGFYLAGLSVAQPRLFGIDGYGTANAMSNLEKRARSMQLDYELLSPMNDMDTLFDLQCLYSRLRSSQEKPQATWGALMRLKDEGVPVAERSISVVVPVYNEEKQIPALIENLGGMKPYCELLFVDGGSTDSTVHLLSPEFKVLQSVKGRGKQLNCGARASHGELLLFLHADSRLPKGALAEVRRVLKTSSFGCFGIRFTSKRPAMICCSFLSNFRAKYRRTPFGDQGMFMERSLFNKLGGFKDLPLMEDYQMSLDLQELGVRPVLAHKRILTSSRRYDGSLFKQLGTMVHMGRLRKMYRDGKDPQYIASLYADIR